MKRESPAKSWPLWLKLLVVAAVAATMALPFLLWGDQMARVFADREQVAAEIRGAGVWGPAVLIALSVGQTVVAPIPGQVINFVAGYVYGPWLGLLYSWLGLVFGSAIAMLLARFGGRPLVERLVPPGVLSRLDSAVRGKSLGFFFLFFLIPGLPDDLLCFTVGFTRLPLRVMLPMAAIARLPGLLGAVLLGAEAESLPFGVWVVLGVLGLIAVVLFWRFGDRLEAALLRRMGGQRRGS